MAVVHEKLRFVGIAVKWHALAKKRLAYLRALERSGRWRLFYTPEKFSVSLHDAEQTVLIWADLAGAQGRARADMENMRAAG
ncbi:MAG TPA: hypothetical protein VJR71_04025 [Pseudolabrys sp.]|nr:hypothetical protein [Pseudolabrys sp.]